MMKKTFALILSLLLALCLFAGCGEKAAETPAETAETTTAAAQPAGDAAVPSETGTTWADYQQYLKDNSQGAPDYDEFAAQVDALTSWDDIDLTVSPWDMLFSENGPHLSTYEEFCAGTVRTAAVGGADASASGSKASGVPSGDKASGTPSGNKASGTPSGDKASGTPADDGAANASTSVNGAHGGNGDTSEAAYKEYLKAFITAENKVNDNMDDAAEAEFDACIDAGTYDVFPADMLFNGMLNTGSAMTYDEFVAAGGVY